MTEMSQVAVWFHQLTDDQKRRLCLAWIVAIWAGVHAVFWDTFIYHDAWKHLFPILMNISREMGCEGIPHWLGSVDSGSAHSIFVISKSVTNLVRLPLLFTMSCFDPDVVNAVHIYRAGILVTYLLFAAGLYVLGALLFKSRWSAVFLFALTLFAGFFLQTLHSDQATNLVFYYPWIAALIVLFFREYESRYASMYLNAAAVLIALQALDQAPHVTAVALLLGFALCAWLAGRDMLEGLRLHWVHLWPALIIAIVGGAQLYVVHSQIFEYLPSLRADIVVHPSQFGETGFLQPSAFLGTLLPVSFAHQFQFLAEASGQWLIATGQPGGTRFIFFLDLVLFNIGMIPLVFAIFFFCHPAARRPRMFTGWFVLLLTLITLQQTRLFYLTFHLPFFDVFRAYLLLYLAAVVPVFVASGYGFDLLSTQTGSIQQTATARTLRTLRIIYGSVAAIILILIVWVPYRGPGDWGELFLAIAIDAAGIVAGVLLLLWWGTRWSAWSVQVRQMTAIGVLVAFGVIGTAISYSVYGISKEEVFNQFTLDADDQTALSQEIKRDPDQFRRKLCTNYEQCYLSRRPSASLNLDLDGTFLRSRGEAVFQEGLAQPAVKALSGITHPVFWISDRAVGYQDIDTVTAAMNENADDIGEFLRRQTFVRMSDLGALAGEPADTSITRDAPGADLLELDQGKDRFSLSYTSDHSFFLNAAVTHNPFWTATLAGERLPLVEGNYGGLLIEVPAGAGQIDIEFYNPGSIFFFWSRIAFLLIAAVSMAVLTRKVIRLSASEA